MVPSGRLALAALALAGMLLTAGGTGALGAAPGEQPSSSNVFDHVATISDWYRYLASPEHWDAADYIEQTLEGYGLEVYRQEFTVNQYGQPLDAANVVGYYEGEDPDTWVVMGGHYDATELADSGAYDNAAGVATVLELARYFTQEVEAKPKVSLVFAAWDSEEQGAQGSELFVEQAGNGTTILANLNFDMYGISYPVENPASISPFCDEDYFFLNVYTSPVEDFSGYDSYDYDEETRENFTALRQVVERVTYGNLELPPEWVLVMDDTVTASDHRSFIRAGLPAVWFRGMHEQAYQAGDACEQTIKHYSTDRLSSMVAIAGGRSELEAAFQTGLDIAHHIIWELAGYDDAGTGDDGDDGDGLLEGAGDNPLLWLLPLFLIAGVAVWVRFRSRSGEG